MYTHRTYKNYYLTEEMSCQPKKNGSVTGQNEMPNIKDTVPSQRDNNAG